MTKKEIRKKITPGENAFYKVGSKGDIEFNTNDLSKKDIKALVRVIKVLKLDVIPF